jgi:hypothetical protein
LAQQVQQRGADAGFADLGVGAGDEHAADHAGTSEWLRC